MKKRSYRIVAAIIIAASSIFWIYSHTVGAKQDPKETTTVYAAKKKIEKGHPIKSEDLEVITNYPKEKDSPDMVHTQTEIDQKVANVDIYEGEIIRLPRINPAEINYAPDDQEVNLAVTLDLLGGNPKRGDYVDVLAYSQNKGGSKSVEGAQIITITNSLGSELTPEFLESQKSNGGSQQVVPAVVTLKVSPAQALKLHEDVSNSKIRIVKTHLNKEKSALPKS